MAGAMASAPGIEEVFDGGEIAGKFPQFEILGCLGRGGMGIVYKARQKSLNRLVAIKILSPELAKEPGFSQRFAREAELLAKLNHPHIVTIHDSGEVGGLFYFVMEFVDGVSLRDLLDDGKLEPAQALAIVPEICAALQFAHDKGIIHRDIKPGNILLDKNGRVKVADFGLAKLAAEPEPPSGPLPSSAASPLTEAGKIWGTPEYMAPEQSEKPEEVDHRADIYALGVVFYQMLTGELPGQKLDPPSRKVKIDVHLDEVVLRALEKNPALRYENATSFKTAVETAAGKTPPPLPTDRDMAGEAARHPVPGTTLAAIALCAAALLLGLLIPSPAALAAVLIGGLGLAATLVRVRIASWKMGGETASAEGIPRSPWPAVFAAACIGAASASVAICFLKPLPLGGVLIFPASFAAGIGVLFSCRFWSGSTRKFFHGKRFALAAIFAVLTAFLPVSAFFLLRQKPPGEDAANPAGEANRDYAALGADFVDLLADGKFAEAASGFAPEMRRALPEPKLEAIWSELGTEGGKFLSRGELRVRREGRFFSAYVPCRWERNRLDIKVVFDKSGKVSGLWKLPPSSPEIPPPQSEKHGDAEDSPSSEGRKAAVRAAGDWLALVDAGDYAKSWTDASTLFRSGIGESGWKAALEGARKPLGKLLSRKLASAQEATSLPGAPDGHYAVLEFHASFERKAEAVETVTFLEEADGSWRAAGYFIR